MHCPTSKFSISFPYTCRSNASSKPAWMSLQRPCSHILSFMTSIVFQNYRTIVRGIHRSFVNFPHKRIIMRNLDVFWYVCLNSKYIAEWAVAWSEIWDAVGLLPDPYNCGMCMRRERFPNHRLQRTPLFSDPGMHHGMCVTRAVVHVWIAWGQRTQHSRRMRNPQFYVSVNRPWR